MSVHLFGVRHHGVGSARALQRALDALHPDVVLIEGPAEAASVQLLAGNPAMQPPVALLIYNPTQPAQAVWYPFAVFSPEWIAIQYALQNGILLEFIDLPQKHMLALTEHLQELAYPQTPSPSGDREQEPHPPSPMPIDDEENEAAAPTPPRDDSAPGIAIRRDPLGALARAAGYNDGERWWDSLIEQRGHGDPMALFEAVGDAMAVLRASVMQMDAETMISVDLDIREELREAWMRTRIDVAERQYKHVAVVCGAWHVPMLTEARRNQKGSMKFDIDLLKNLPSVKTEATWAPWTYERLSMVSGYGAGIASPGWYDHLWTTPPDQVSARWLARVAALLRGEDLNASTAQVIDGVRLAETLAALRDRAVPTLDEMNETALAVFCRGDSAPMRLIERRLIVGERMGAVPEGTPMVPLQRDLEMQQRTLKFKSVAEPKDHDFDLRKPTDFARSILLHRLTLLSVNWGVPTKTMARTQGTFHEFWRVQWHPEMMIQLIVASQWGNTVRDAASASASHVAATADDLAWLIAILGNVLLADLPDAADAVVQRLADVAALTTDVALLMDALPKLIDVARYGDVRTFRADHRITVMRIVVDGLVTRICVGVLPACYALDDDAAGAMFKRLNAAHSAIGLLQDAGQTAAWTAALRGIADDESINGVVGGRAVRLLRDNGTFPQGEVTRRMRLALSTAVQPTSAAAWIEGFLRDSGAVLIHDDALLVAVDAWVASLDTMAFEHILPLLRRTFSSFQAPERRMIGERAQRGARASVSTSALDVERADRVLPALARLLGVEA